MIAATSLSSRVTLNLPVRARAVSTRAARAAVVRVAADGEESSGYKSMNVTKPNIVNNLDGETTRNIDGKVYTITVKDDEVTVKRFRRRLGIDRVECVEARPLHGIPRLDGDLQRRESKATDGNIMGGRST